MSEEEFFNRLLNKIDKEFGYDTASTLELMFMTKEKKIEQLENIRKEAIEYIKNNKETREHYEPYGTPMGNSNYTTTHIFGYYELLDILNKGDNNGK